MESSICTVSIYSNIFLVFKLYSSGLQIMPLISDHLRFMAKIKWKVYAKVKHREKRASSWEEGLSSLPEGEWAIAESQRVKMQDEVKIVCRGATPWKTDIFLRGRIELFTGRWVSWCCVPKRDDTENEKNDYKTEKGNRKRKYIMQLNV